MKYFDLAYNHTGTSSVHGQKKNPKNRAFDLAFRYSKIHWELLENNSIFGSATLYTLLINNLNHFKDSPSVLKFLPLIQKYLKYVGVLGESVFFLS